MANIYLDQILGGGYISGYSGVSGFSGLGLSGYSGIGTSGFSGYSGISGWSGSGGGGGGATLSAVAASTTYYVGLSANSTGSWTDARVATSNLYYTSGDGTLYATNMNTASDMNLKDNILTITNPLHTLSELHGVEFTWKNTGRKSYGVIAQELEKVLPELVNVVDGYKSVNYNAIIGFLLEAVKELSNKIDRLEAK